MSTIVGCARCGTMKLVEESCDVCRIIDEHEPDCQQRLAAEAQGSDEWPECYHGKAFCKDRCDRCTCNAYSRRLGQIQHQTHFCRA